MTVWLPRPRIWFGAPPSIPQPPVVLAPVDDGPEPDAAAHAPQKAAAEPEPPTERDERFHELGRYTRRAELPPLPTGFHGCPRCAGLQQTVRQLEGERAQLRRRLARHELAATRNQRLRSSEQLP